MQKLIKVTNYAIQFDRFGGIELCKLSAGKSVYFQPGDDANRFARHVEHVPFIALDIHCSDYDHVMV